MGRKHLTPKRHLGNEIDEEVFAVGERLRAAVDAAQRRPAPAPMATAKQASEPPGAPLQPETARAGSAPAFVGAEASLIEEQAVVEGAEILLELEKEGPITSLTIILIPEEHRQNRRVAALGATFGFVAELPGRRRIAVAVPRGYVTDFASIPGFVQWLIAPFGKHSEAAVVHDWLYTLGTPGDRKTRKLADLTFRRALALVGVKFFRRNLMYWAVRVGGRSGYGLESDYDFRELERLKRRIPPPERDQFMITWKEQVLTREEHKRLKEARKAARKRASEQAASSGQPERAAAPPPAPQAELSPGEAKSAAQETMVAVEQR